MYVDEHQRYESIGLGAGEEFDGLSNESQIKRDFVCRTDSAIAVVLAEIDAELERRIARINYGFQENEYCALTEFRSYIRALGEGGDDGPSEAR